MSDSGLECGAVMPVEDPDKEDTRFLFTELQEKVSDELEAEDGTDI